MSIRYLVFGVSHLHCCKATRQHKCQYVIWYLACHIDIVAKLLDSTNIMWTNVKFTRQLSVQTTPSFIRRAVLEMKHWLDGQADTIPLLCILIDWLTPWSRVLLEKLTVTQLVKKFCAFYGTQRFIAVFTRAHHWSFHTCYIYIFFLQIIHTNWYSKISFLSL
jgi:hypothetical protein